MVSVVLDVQPTNRWWVAPNDCRLTHPTMRTPPRALTTGHWGYGAEIGASEGGQAPVPTSTKPSGTVY